MDYTQLKAKPTSIKGKITQIQNWFNASAAPENNAEIFLIKNPHLEITLKVYNEIQDAIEALRDYQTHETEDRNDIETTIDNLSAQMQMYIKQCTLTASRSQTQISLTQEPTSMPQFKLPDIKINDFTGKNLNWQLFIQLLNYLITDNSTLPDVQKCIYLK